LNLLNQYGKIQREWVWQYLQDNTPLTRPEAEICLQHEERIMAILRTDLVQNFCYSPIQIVVWIQKATDNDKAWLYRYWHEKYELDLTAIGHGIEYIAGLILGTTIYTFPENIIGFYIKEKSKTN
jgi:hypothetical protein